MTRSVDEIDEPGFAVVIVPGEADRLSLDGDAAFPLEIHGIEDLATHFALVEAAADLDQTISQSRLSMIDVGDDRDISDVVERHHGSLRTQGSAGALADGLDDAPGEGLDLALGQA